MCVPVFMWITISVMTVSKKQILTRLGDYPEKALLKCICLPRKSVISKVDKTFRLKFRQQDQPRQDNNLGGVTTV